MPVGIRIRRSGLTCCNATDTCCFYRITSSAQPISITFYVNNELKRLLRFFMKKNESTPPPTPWRPINAETEFKHNVETPFIPDINLH